MHFDRSRLRRGELLAGGGAVVLLFSLFLLPWYGVKGLFEPTAATLPGAGLSVDGWHGLSDLRWLTLITVALALALVWLQASRNAPALPVAVSVILTVVGLIEAIALLYRVLINVPGPNSIIDRKVGGFVGLVAAIVLEYGAFRSLREEGISPRDAPSEIEAVTVAPGEPDRPSPAS
jgi:hypothetical protein